MNALVNTPARIGKVGAALIAMCVATVSLVGVGTAGAQSSTGSTGSFDFGSSVPEIFRDDPGPLPVLRDDITAAAVVGEEHTGVQASRLTIASPALKREVGVEVLLPADNSVPRPTLYMLQGVDGGEGSNGWVTMGGAPAFFADKNAYVVMINGGSASLFSDWESADPALGLHKWETFIAKELPPLIDDHFGTNGVNAIAGTSMGAQGAMMLAHRYPDLYRGVAVFSGCYSTMDTWGRTSVQATITSRGGDPANMWGELGGPQWEAHDSVLNAERLRGKEIYISTANGAPGVNETLQTPELLERLVVGGGIEAAAKVCTKVFDQRLRSLDIEATVDYEPNGTHAWAYWRERLPKAWPTLSKALGV